MAKLIPILGEIKMKPNNASNKANPQNEAAKTSTNKTPEQEKRFKELLEKLNKGTITDAEFVEFGNLNAPTVHFSYTVSVSKTESTNTSKNGKAVEQQNKTTSTTATTNDPSKISDVNKEVAESVTGKRKNANDNDEKRKQAKFV